MRFYYLDDDKNIIPHDDIALYAKMFEDPKRRIIKQTELTLERHSKNLKVVVSTVFLCINHNWTPGGDPLLFETMIFGDLPNEYQTRCHTYHQALNMHQQAISTMNELGFYE